MAWADTLDLNFVLTKSSQNERMPVATTNNQIQDVYVYEK